MASTTSNRAAKEIALSRSSRPATDGNKNVKATRSPEAGGNGTLGATEALIRKNTKGPFLGTSKPTG